jgi:cytochrome P450
MATSPPRVPLPKVAQTLRFIARPISFLEHWRARLGETFHASIYGPGEVVFISDPDAMRDLFKADRVNTIAPGRTIALGALLGPGSLLLQEGDEHLRRRKLMLPRFMESACAPTRR